MGDAMGGLLVVVIAAAAAGTLVWYFMSRNRESMTPPSPQQGSRAAIEDPKAGSRRNWLIGTGGDVEGRHFHVGERIVTIGRKPANFIQITDRDGSRTHCNLRPTPTGMKLADLNSANGTYVNGKRVREADIREGDEIRIGQARFIFRREADFARDDVQRHKQIDSSVHEATAAGGNIQTMVARMMAESRGDTAEVARRLGVPEASLKVMLKASEQDRN